MSTIEETAQERKQRLQAAAAAERERELADELAEKKVLIAAAEQKRLEQRLAREAAAAGPIPEAAPTADITDDDA